MKCCNAPGGLNRGVIEVAYGRPKSQDIKDGEVMAESIFRRISRLLSASAEDAVDQMERAGGEAVMREAIREADRAIDQVKAEHEAIMARRLNAVRQQQMLAKKV